MWINLANVTFIYQHEAHLVIVFCDKSRIHLADKSMAIVIEALQECKLNHQPLPDLNELID
jgi:hypothetical protein